MEVNKVCDDLEITPQMKRIEHEGNIGGNPRQPENMRDFIYKTKLDLLGSIGRGQGGTDGNEILSDSSTYKKNSVEDRCVHNPFGVDVYAKISTIDNNNDNVGRKRERV